MGKRASATLRGKGERTHVRSWDMGSSEPKLLVVVVVVAVESVVGAVVAAVVSLLKTLTNVFLVTVDPSPSCP